MFITVVPPFDFAYSRTMGINLPTISAFIPSFEKLPAKLLMAAAELDCFPGNDFKPLSRLAELLVSGAAEIKESVPGSALATVEKSSALSLVFAYWKIAPAPPDACSLTV